MASQLTDGCPIFKESGLAAAGVVPVGDGGGGIQPVVHSVRIPWFIGGVLAVDGDDGYNGGGLCGANQVGGGGDDLDDDYCLSYDAGTTTFVNISNSNAAAPWTTDWQLFPDTMANGDCCYFGDDQPFTQLSFNLDAVSTYTGAGTVWEYWNGAAWTAFNLTTVPHWDTTDGAGGTVGTRSWGQDGNVMIKPMGNWAANIVNSKLGYWIRCRITDTTKITTTPKMDAELPRFPLGLYHAQVPANFTLTEVEFCDGKIGTLPSNTTQFTIRDSASRELRTFSKTATRAGTASLAGPGGVHTWDLTTAARLDLHCFKEDGTNESANVMITLVGTYF